MQTFLPYHDIERSMKALDYQRLGKQRIEALQLVRASIDPTLGWRNHPARRMWEGHELALVRYGLLCCAEWMSRGFVDTQWEKFDYFKKDPLIWATNGDLPPWFDEAFHRSHRANLVRKNPSFYQPLFGDLSPEPYIWPK